MHRMKIEVIFPRNLLSLPSRNVKPSLGPRPTGLGTLASERFCSNHLTDSLGPSISGEHILPILYPQWVNATGAMCLCTPRMNTCANIVFEEHQHNWAKRLLTLSTNTVNGLALKQRTYLWDFPEILLFRRSPV